MAILSPSVDYIDKDFDALRARLIALVRSVFPDWSDFSVATFGNVLLEMYAFVGDVVTFYLDAQARESRLVTATQRKNVIALARMLGYDNRGELIDTLTDIRAQLFVNPGDRDATISVLEEGGEVKNREMRWKRKDGTVIWVSASIKVVRGSAGEIAYFEGVVSDITERRKAEFGLEASERKYRLLVDRMQDGLYLIQNERFVFVNQSLARMLGYAVNDLLGRHFDEVLAPESRTLVREYYEKRQAGLKVPSVYECKWLHRDQKTEIAVILNVGLTTSQDGLIATIGTVKDITDRVRIEEALRESEERFRSILWHAVTALIGIDEDGIIQFFNPAAEDIFGYASAAIIGRNVSTLMPEPDSGAHDRYLQRYLRDGQKRIIGIGREVTGQRADGREFPLYLGIGETQWRGRAMFIGSVIDLTERKMLEQELSQSHKMEAVGQLTGGIAHDFNNLLATILGSLELVQEHMIEGDRNQRRIDREWGVGHQKSPL